MVVDQYAAGRGLRETGEAVEQRGLAAPVAAQHAPQLTRRQLEVAAQHARADCNRESVRAQLHGRRDNRNNSAGTPSNAVNTPTGSCCGAHTVRANVSASVTKLPPTNADAGNNQRWWLMPVRRSACGTMMPTNPMLPPSSTAAT